jgi:hypothetical protein
MNPIKRYYFLSVVGDLGEFPQNTGFSRDHVNLAHLLWEYQNYSIVGVWKVCLKDIWWVV